MSDLESLREKITELLKSWEGLKDNPEYGGDLVDVLADGLIERERSAAAEAERLRTAIHDCIKWANGHEGDWGDRAENSFAFLYKALESNS